VIILKDYEIKRYKRIHKFSNPSDVEKGKIKKETDDYLKLTKNSKRLSVDILRNITNLSDFDESTYEEIEGLDLKASKEKNNAKVHKKRLQKLENHEDFD